MLDAKTAIQDFKEHKNNHGNMIPPKEHNNFSVTDSKDMEICNLPDKEFKVFFKVAQWTTRKHKNKI